MGYIQFYKDKEDDLLPNIIKIAQTFIGAMDHSSISKLFFLSNFRSTRSQQINFRGFNKRLWIVNRV